MFRPPQQKEIHFRDAILIAQMEKPPQKIEFIAVIRVLKEERTELIRKRGVECFSGMVAEQRRNDGRIEIPLTGVLRIERKQERSPPAVFGLPVPIQRKKVRVFSVAM